MERDVRIIPVKKVKNQFTGEEEEVQLERMFQDPETGKLSKHCKSRTVIDPITGKKRVIMPKAVFVDPYTGEVE